jgi:uncharacterized phage infection (PIP) family protein YhgE
MIRLLVIPISSRSSRQFFYLYYRKRSADVQKQDALDKAKAELESIDQKLAESAISLKEAQKGREETVSWTPPLFAVAEIQDERAKLLQTLREVNETASGLKSELAAFGAADPVKYERKKDAVRVAKEAAQRWTGKLDRVSMSQKLMM